MQVLPKAKVMAPPHITIRRVGCCDRSFCLRHASRSGVVRCRFCLQTRCWMLLCVHPRSHVLCHRRPPSAQMCRGKRGSRQRRDLEIHIDLEIIHTPTRCPVNAALNQLCHVSPKKVIASFNRLQLVFLEIVSVVLVHLSAHRSQTRANVSSIKSGWRPFLLLTVSVHR